MSRGILKDTDIEIRYDCPEGCEVAVIDRCIEKLNMAKEALKEVKEGEDVPDVIENYHRYYFNRGVGDGRLIFTQRMEGENSLS